jgi:hypothetical protein
MLCCACFQSRIFVPLSISSKASIMWVNIGSFMKHACKVRCSAGTSTWNRFCTTPVTVSGSVQTSHSLPSPHSFGVPSYCQLMPSAILLVPRMYCMSTILYASTPSHQCACVACTSLSAYVLISLCSYHHQQGLVGLYSRCFCHTKVVCYCEWCLGLASKGVFLQNCPCYISPLFRM